MKENAVRSRIMEVASRLFFHQGYNSTGINQIIDEASIARASLYKYFPSKEELLMAYLKEADQDYFQQLIDALANVKEPKLKLWAFFEFRLGRQQRNNFAGCQFFKVSAEVPRDQHEVFKLVEHQKERLKKLLGDIVQEMNRDTAGKLSDQALTEAIFLLLEGATVTGSIYRTSDALKTAKKITEQLL